MKKIAFIAIPMLSLAVLGGIFAGGLQTTECKACELGETPVAVCRVEDDKTTGVDNFLPDDDVFGQSGGIDEEFGEDENNRPRPEPRERNGNEADKNGKIKHGSRQDKRADDTRPDGKRPLPIANGDENGSPNGDIYFIIYGHLPLPPAPRPIPENNGNKINDEIPDGELG